MLRKEEDKESASASVGSPGQKESNVSADVEVFGRMTKARKSVYPRRRGQEDKGRRDTTLLESHGKKGIRQLGNLTVIFPVYDNRPRRNA